MRQKKREEGREEGSEIVCESEREGETERERIARERGGEKYTWRVIILQKRYQETGRKWNLIKKRKKTEIGRQRKKGGWDGGKL